MECKDKKKIWQLRRVKNQRNQDYKKLGESYVDRDLDRDILLEVVLALECAIIKGTDASRTFLLKRMLTETKRMYNELGGNYEWCKKISDLYKQIQKKVLFTDKQINDKLLKKTKSKCNKYKEIVDLFALNADKFVENNEKEIIPIKVSFPKKRNDIDRSTLYSFDGIFQLLHADVGNLKIPGKSATDPKYCLLFLNLFTSRIYVYPIKSRKVNSVKNGIFLQIEGRSGQKTRLQTDLEFWQQQKLTAIKNVRLNVFNSC